MQNIIKTIGGTVLLILLVSCQQAKSEKRVQSQDVAALTAAYGEAWSSRDAARIASYHSDDSEFVLHVAGATPIVGRAAVEEAFKTLLADNPDYASRKTLVKTGSDFVVVEYEITTGPDRPFKMGETCFAPRTSDYRIPAIDLILFEDGEVIAKHTFIDTETMRLHVDPMPSGGDCS